MFVNRWKRRRTQRNSYFLRTSGLLDSPLTTKTTEILRNESYYVAASSMQGWRVNMEDAHKCFLELPRDPEAAFFGVFDGHGGDVVSRYVAEKLHFYLMRRPEYSTNMALALRRSFLDLDLHLMAHDNICTNMVGCTATVVLIKDSKVYCANAGDSRAIASAAGTVDCLSKDHKPDNEVETKRILEAGGYIEANRINGSLAVSRAFGDSHFKNNPKKKTFEQMVTANPDVEEREVSDSLEFILMATDGIWDVLSNTEALNFCRSRLTHCQSPAAICEDLLDSCVARTPDWQGVGTDNMTIIFIGLSKSKFYRELVVYCETRGTSEETISRADGQSIAKYRLFHRSSETSETGSFADRVKRFFRRQPPASRRAD